MLGVLRCLPCPAGAAICLALGSALFFPGDASASRVYVSNAGSNTISAFSIGAGGALSPIACSEPNCKTGTRPDGVAVSPNGQLLYVADGSSNTVSGFSIGPGGALTPIACSEPNCKTGTRPFGLAVSPNGQFLYTSNLESNTISAFSIGPGGALTTITCSEPNCKTGTRPVGVAVSPNGRFLYSSNLSSSTISAFSIGSGGGLTPITCSEPNCNTGSGPEGMAVSPNGQFLYVANDGAQTVSVFSIGAGGALTPISCSASSCETGLQPSGVAVSPNGQFLFTSNYVSETVSAFSIGSDGLLSPIACSEPNCKTGSKPEGGVAVSPNGQFLYVSNRESNTISAFSIGSGGALSPIACSEPNCKTGTGPSFQSLVMSPDQAPTAAFTDTPASAGSVSGFDGSASTASPEQSVSRYDWSFGDGTTAQNAGPTPSHTYSALGTYTVSLTVTDNAGCSTQLIFTGQTVSCNGSTVASTTRTLTVPPPIPPLALVTVIPLLAPTLSSLSETAKTWREGNTLAHISKESKKKTFPLGTTFSFSLSEPASVTFTFTKPASGRKVGKTCVAQTKKNTKKHRCIRTVVAGTLVFSAHAGTNKVRFEGLISKHHKLKPGSYTLHMTATASGKHSTTGTLHFTIANG